jgi:hypothetical protein
MSISSISGSSGNFATQTQAIQANQDATQVQKVKSDQNKDKDNQAAQIAQALQNKTPSASVNTSGQVVGRHINVSA